MYRPAIGQPRVLLVVSHPAVGSGVETLLRLERRYDVRRVARLADAVRMARSWPADAALVDAAMIPRGDRLSLGVPAMVLAGAEAEGAPAVRSLDDPRGWVPKDAPAAELVAAVERLLTNATQGAAGSLALFAVGVLVVVLVGLFAYLLWLALV